MADLSLSRSQLLLLAGTANRPLAEEMAEHLGQPLCAVTIRRFADGEIFVKIDENVRGRDVFIIQPTNPPAENHLELLFLIDAARRASAARITAVLPYFGYARQDRKDQPRVAISAKLMANLITAAGADRVLGMDFHSHQLQGFFDIPVDHLYAAPVFVSHFRQKQLYDPVVVAPDVGSAKMARGFAKRLNASLAIIDKRRPSANVAEVVNVVGEVADPAARIEAPIGRDVKHRQRMVVVAGGREAITEFVRLGVAGGHSLLQVSLTTGRTHQIRVHLAFIKHPVLGDPVYGHQSPLIGRPALHAETLTLRHPRTGKSMTWQAAPPEDFELAWNSLSVRTMR